MPDYLPIPRFPLPDDLAPEGTICVRITIPADQQYLSTLIGLIDLLKWSRNFARDPSGTGAATVSRTWQSALESEPIEVEGCDMPDFRINPLTCLLEVNCSDDPEVENWQPVFTPAYDPSTDAPEPESLYPDPPPPGESNACLAAANLTALMQNGANNIRALMVGGGAFGAVLQNIFSLLSTFVSIVQAQFWIDGHIAWSTWNAATIQADYEAFNWDDLKNLLVCYLDENGQWLGSITFEKIASFNAALNEVNDRIPDSQIWSIISFAMTSMGWIGTSLATTWGGITSADCDACDSEWIITFDGAPDPDYEIVYGSIVDSGGERGNVLKSADILFATWNAIAVCKVVFTAGTISKTQFDWSGTTGQGTFVGVYHYNSSGVQQNVWAQNLFAGDWSTFVAFEGSVNINEGDYFEYWLDASSLPPAPTGVELFMNVIKIYGQGVLP